jgi:hypothetical protein
MSGTRPRVVPRTPKGGPTELDLPPAQSYCPYLRLRLLGNLLQPLLEAAFLEIVAGAVRSGAFVRIIRRRV